jgi:uncharacterized membrane protein YpjA
MTALPDRLPAWVTTGRELPPRADLPWLLAPIPRRVEDAGLALAPWVVLVNLLGTAFGVWYYRFQLSVEPVVVWPLVPDSPAATLFAALAFGGWWLGRRSETVAALAVLGCWKLGLWTPVMLVAFADEFLGATGVPLYLFLLTSHLAMVIQALVVHRVADFPPHAIAVAVGWYTLNDIVDYAVPVVGTPHHTLLPGQAVTASGTGFTHPAPVHGTAASAAVALTLTGVTLLFGIHLAMRR